MIIRCQLGLVFFAICATSVSARAAYADVAINCDLSALAAETQANTTEIQSLTAKMQSSAVAPGELQIVLNHVKALEDHLSACSTTLTGDARDSVLVAMFNGADARVALLRALGRTEEANTLAKQIAAHITYEMASASPAIGLASANRLMDIQAALLSVQPTSDECSEVSKAAGADVMSQIDPDHGQLQLAECYFAARDWARAIPIYVDIGDHFIADGTPYVTQYWHLGVSYAALEKMHEARAALIRAHDGYFADKASIDPSVAAGMLRDYVRLGAKRSQDQAVQNQVKAYVQKAAQAIRNYAKGLPPEERELVLTRGIPCHVETYEGAGGYHTETFWYCDADGNYEEAYTFTNGHETSHYVP